MSIDTSWREEYLQMKSGLDERRIRLLKEGPWKDAIDCLHAATPQDRISVLEEFDDWLFAEDEDYEVLWLPKGEEM